MTNPEQMRKYANLLTEGFDPMAGPGPNEYQDSAEFTNDFYTVHDQLTKMQELVNSEKWVAWMNITDENYMTSCAAESENFAEALNQAVAIFQHLVEQIESAE